MSLQGFELLKNKKKQKILDAIASCLKVKDYDELSINDIAKSADISRGSFYNYFTDKNDAVTSLVISRLDKLQDIFKTCIHKSHNNLFEGSKLTYELIQDTLKNNIYVVVIRNIKFFKDIVSNIIYSKSYDNKMKELLDWVIENTDEGRTILNDRKKMANVLELIFSLFLNSTFTLTIKNEPILKYEDYNYKIEIIKKGIF